MSNTHKYVTAFLRGGINFPGSYDYNTRNCDIIAERWYEMFVSLYLNIPGFHGSTRVYYFHAILYSCATMKTWDV